MVGGLFGIFTTGNKFWLTFQDKTTIQGELRRAVFAMTKELREAKGILVTKDPETTTILFNRLQHGTVSYNFYLTGPHAHQILRENNAETKILANNISVFEFDYENNTVFIDVTATLQTKGSQSVSFRMKEEVTLRE